MTEPLSRPTPQGQYKVHSHTMTDQPHSAQERLAHMNAMHGWQRDLTAPSAEDHLVAHIAMPSEPATTTQWGFSYPNTYERESMAGSIWGCVDEKHARECLERVPTGTIVTRQIGPWVPTS